MSYCQDSYEAEGLRCFDRWIQCNNYPECTVADIFLDPWETAKTMRKDLKKLGWTNRGKKDYCPKCSQDLIRKERDDVHSDP